MKIIAAFFSLALIVSSHFGSSLFALSYVSQVGQDRWVIEEVFNFKRNGYFVDIGAAEGCFISNTYVLEKNLNWQGICIEANPYYFKHLILNRSSINVNACLDYTNHEVDFRCDNGLFAGIVDADTDNKSANQATNSYILKLQTRTLEQVLDECKAPSIIDFLSIDVEGAEHRVFRNFPFHKYKFLAMVIERPTHELNRQLQSNGYVFVKNGPYDSFYVHSSIPNFQNIPKDPFSQMRK